jgi:twitching motility protein PilT
MAMSFGASDIHLRAGSFPVIRVNGELRPISGANRLTQDETLEMAFSMMSNRQKMHFKEAYEVDIGYGVSGFGQIPRQHLSTERFNRHRRPRYFRSRS